MKSYLNTSNVINKPVPRATQTTHIFDLNTSNVINKQEPPSRVALLV